MRKLNSTSIQTVLNLACVEFKNDVSAPAFVGFFYKGHYVSATIDWSYERSCFYVYDFLVVYSNCVMRYKVNVDFDFDSACCL